MWIEYFLMGFLAPLVLNLIHLVINIYVVTARGSIMSLGLVVLVLLLNRWV